MKSYDTWPITNGYGEKEFTSVYSDSMFRALITASQYGVGCCGWLSQNNKIMVQKCRSGGNKQNFYPKRSEALSALFTADNTQCTDQ